MSIDDHARALAIDVLNMIITDIKESRPTYSNGTSTSGFVYSQLSPGLMVNPRDFARPWTPMGGSPPSAGAAGAPLPPGIAQPPQAPSTGAKRAMEAAFKTAEEFDKFSKKDAAAYRRTVSQLRQLPNDLKLDLDIYDGDIPAIARRAIYGA